MTKEKPNSGWKQVMRHFWAHAKNYKLLLATTYVSYTVAVITDAVLVTYIYKVIIDKMTNFVTHNTFTIIDRSSDFAESVLWYFGVIALVLLVDRVLYSVGDYSMSVYQSRAMRDMLVYSFKNTTTHSYQFFTNSFVGALVKKTGRFVGSFENVNDLFMYGIWLPVVRLVSVFVVLFFVAPFIGWVYFIWTVIFLGLSFYLTRKKLHYDLLEAEADSKTTARIADVFTNILNLKLFSSKKREDHTFAGIAHEQMTARLNAWNFQNSIYILQGVIVTWLQIMSLFVSISLWFDGYITLGTIVLVYNYSGTIFDSVWGLGKQLSKVTKAFSDAAEMVDILDLPIEIKDSTKPEPLKVDKGQIDFDHVSFAYKQGRNIFEDFNLVLRAGEKVGIVGTSGAGKSTITKLLLRFADVTGGAIKIDGQDIRHITQDDLRGVISYVPQDPILFHRTLRENIAYGKPDATEDEIVDAAKKAHAHEFISGLKYGYDTLVGERGVKLSGGERQRVAIARAILKNAPILVLDEATSALDSVSEEYIQDALNELMRGKTVIVIAHRLSTIQKLDRILVMEQGAVIEEGSHKELIAKKGVYADFWNRQAGGFIE